MTTLAGLAMARQLLHQTRTIVLRLWRPRMGRKHPCRSLSAFPPPCLISTNFYPACWVKPQLSSLFLNHPFCHFLILPFSLLPPPLNRITLQYLQLSLWWAFSRLPKYKRNMDTIRPKPNVVFVTRHTAPRCASRLTKKAKGTQEQNVLTVPRGITPGAWPALSGKR